MASINKDCKTCANYGFGCKGIEEDHTTSDYERHTKPDCYESE
jgi:hypothetical protein